MKVKKNIGKIALIGALALGVMGCKPSIKEYKDLTGDNIPDLIIDISEEVNRGTWLFIGQENGDFIAAKEYTRKGITYFKTDKVVYAFDGKFYKPVVIHPKE